jgi:hypothetical protein
MVPYTNYKDFNELDLEFYDVLEEKLNPLVKVKHNDRPKHLQNKHSRKFDVRRLHVNDVKTVKYWVERWNDDTGDLDLWGSDQEDEDEHPNPPARSNQLRKKKR